MRKQAISRISAAVLICSSAGSVFLLRTIDRIRTRATLEETLYSPSPQLLKRLSLGYEGLLADV